MGFEHGMESMQEFAHDGDQGLHFEFALSEQMLIEGARVTHTSRRFLLGCMRPTNMGKISVAASYP
jgi:hypothetical protein